MIIRLKIISLLTLIGLLLISLLTLINWNNKIQHLEFQLKIANSTYNNYYNLKDDYNKLQNENKRLRESIDITIKEYERLRVNNRQLRLNK